MRERRAIIITGPSRGLGSELVDLLIAAGACPIAVGRRLDLRHEAVAQKGACIFVAADLSVAANFDNIDLDGAIPRSASEIVFINNAGVIEPIGPLSTVHAEALATAFSINALAPIILARRLLAAADDRRVQLRILNISTGAARNPFSGLGAYCGGKAAARMLFDCLAKERPDIAIEHIEPGVFDTDMQSALRNASDAALPNREEFQRYASEGKLRAARDVARDILTSRGLQ
jgi:benzil reductase ((S)-benzoin forming)